MTDLSYLTPEEQKQFDDDNTTLVSGDTDVALYMRYSSDRQSEQSIEGQLRDCIAYCKRKQYRITAIYVDRATSARKEIEKRLGFQRMITDSSKRAWEIVLVWKLDRFARNREDSAIAKMKLRKNGVRVESATEAISGTPEGIILESVLEGIAEYYSAELSQKITRGMRESALKAQCIGGQRPLGYKIENHKFLIEPFGAAIVKEAFERYAAGESVAEISDIFNSRGYRTSKGTKFNKSSFKSIFNNVRYIGTYTYKDITIENAIPAIVDKELFERVQQRIKQNHAAPGTAKATVPYLLSGKLFCGHCGARMNGESGLGGDGVRRRYYACRTRKESRTCDKKLVPKDWIEEVVAQSAMALLDDKIISEIATMAIEENEKDIAANTRIPELEARIAEIDRGIANLAKAVEKGVTVDVLVNRITELNNERKALSTTLQEEQKDTIKLEKVHIVWWLNRFKEGNIEDLAFKRQLIALFINSVTVWDEPDGYKITTVYNLTSKSADTVRIGFPSSTSTIQNPLDSGCVCQSFYVRTQRHPRP